MKLCFVTTNQDKFREVHFLAKKYAISLQQEVHKLVEPDFDTLEEVSHYKCIEAYKFLQKPLVVDDSGFFFEAFNEFPGVHSAWVYKKIGKDGLFKLLEGKSRQAYAKTACSYTEDGINVKTFTGILKGNIISSNKETILDGSSFPYSYLFIPEGKERPLIEMSLDEICQIDHRSKAFKALFKTLSVIDDALL